MAATVADRRKRGAGAFLHDDDDGPFSLPQLQAKRGRCSPSAAEYLGVSLESDPVESLRLIFATADPEFLRGYYERSGNVLDAAVRAFKDYLASRSEATSADAASAGVARTSNGPELNTPTNGTEWAELIVREMSSASDLIDAKNRAFRILELLNKSTASCNTPDEVQKMRQEHKILKQMLGGLLRQNSILKRAFLTQHNRLNDHQEELSQFKETVHNYQQQIKTLEHENYMLLVHLAHSNKENCTFGHHHNPDVF